MSIRFNLMLGTDAELKIAASRRKLPAWQRQR
jgi:hypothetical protein